MSRRATAGVSTLAPGSEPAAMVDFQERDTSRALDEEDEDSRDGGNVSGPAEDEEAPAAEQEHDHHAHDLESVGVGVLTVSSSRTLESDPSGDAIVNAVEAEGHEIVTRELVGDDLDSVQGAVNQLLGRRDVDVVISTGGTGVSPDDVTIEAIDPLLDKSLPGFGELFRRLSYEDIGAKVVATRAKAGLSEGVAVFALPGSVDAVELGVEEVILPQIGHLAGLAQQGLHEGGE